MFIVDTNVLVYAVNTHSDLHEVCRNLLEHWRQRSSVWYLSWPVIYEFLRVVTHPRVLQRPISVAQAWEFVTAVTASPGLQILRETDQHQKIGSDFFNAHPAVSGNLVFDARTVVLMVEHGVQRVVTEDTDFHHFPEVERVSPREAASL